MSIRLLWILTWHWVATLSLSFWFLQILINFFRIVIPRYLFWTLLFYYLSHYCHFGTVGVIWIPELIAKAVAIDQTLQFILIFLTFNFLRMLKSWTWLLQAHLKLLHQISLLLLICVQTFLKAVINTIDDIYRRNKLVSLFKLGVLFWTRLASVSDLLLSTFYTEKGLSAGNHGNIARNFIATDIYSISYALI